MSYRYYETFVHPAINNHPKPSKILVLNGYNGLIAKELLKYPTVEDIVIVSEDYDGYEMFKTDTELATENNFSLTDGRVKFIASPILEYLKETDEKFDVIFGDFSYTDDRNFEVFYTVEMFTRINEILKDTKGMYVTDSGSLLGTNRASSCIIKTSLESKNYVVPINVYCPIHNYVTLMIHTRTPLQLSKIFLAPTRYIARGTLEAGMVLGNDETYNAGVKVNTMDNPVLNDYFQKDIDD